MVGCQRHDQYCKYQRGTKYMQNSVHGTLGASWCENEDVGIFTPLFLPMAQLLRARGQKYAILNTVEYFWALWNTVEYWIHESFTHQVGSVSALHKPGWIRFTLENTDLHTKNADDDDDDDDDNCICNMWPLVVSFAFHYRKSVVLAPPAAEFDNAKCLRDLKHVYI